MGHFVCFNPHPHAGGDLRKAQALQAWKVSIHTPTRGVTSVHVNKDSFGEVSIHTPTRGVT